MDRNRISSVYIYNSYSTVYVDIRYIFETYNMVQKWQSKWWVELSSSTTGIQSATLSENGWHTTNWDHNDFYIE